MVHGPIQVSTFIIGFGLLGKEWLPNFVLDELDFENGEHLSVCPTQSKCARDSCRAKKEKDRYNHCPGFSISECQSHLYSLSAGFHLFWKIS